jgi:hypothetical protein
MTKEREEMMSATKTHSGNCHCGRVRYEATVDLTQVMECNCSHCRRKGFLLTFISPDQFTLHSGEQDLTAYQFNKKIIQHLFCRTCGVQPFARGKMPDGSPAIAINIRCLEDVDPQALRPMPFDGRNM